MDTKINSLTEQQVSQFSIYREKWLNIGLSTQPTDIPAAEAAVKLCYKLAGLAEPQSIICMDSPLSAISNVLENNQVLSPGLKSASNQILDQVYTQVCNQVNNQVGNKVDNQINNQVWNQVYDRVYDQVRNHVYDQVCDKVWSQIRDQVENPFLPPQPGAGASQVVHLLAGGCHEAGILSFYDYFREVCGLTKETEKLIGLIALAKCCGRWTPCEDTAIIQHRPCFINFDDEKRLHYDNGMAIRYRDGFGVWAIHGVRVDEQIVMKPAEQTVSQIREEGNSEKKRIRIERFGWNRYLTKIGAKVIDSRHNDIENTEETLVRTPDGMVILLPTCKTGRLFSLEVPYDISTCEQAQNWLHGGSNLDSIIGKTRVVGRS